MIVVGAGPAGCTASKLLAEKGYKILQVEKFRMPSKSCSGVLIKKSMELVKRRRRAVQRFKESSGRGIGFVQDAVGRFFCAWK